MRYASPALCPWVPLSPARAARHAASTLISLRSTHYPGCSIMSRRDLLVFFFFNDTATTEIYTLSLHDALPISPVSGEDSSPRSPRSCTERTASTPDGKNADEQRAAEPVGRHLASGPARHRRGCHLDRKSTRLNSSHTVISYAVFCLKKKVIVIFRHPIDVIAREAVVAAHRGIPAVLQIAQPDLRRWPKRTFPIVLRIPVSDLCPTLG